MIVKIAHTIIDIELRLGFSIGINANDKNDSLVNLTIVLFIYCIDNY